jgi:hypothetical protein
MGKVVGGWSSMKERRPKRKKEKGLGFLFEVVQVRATRAVHWLPGGSRSLPLRSHPLSLRDGLSFCPCTLNVEIDYYSSFFFSFSPLFSFYAFP